MITAGKIIKQELTPALIMEYTVLCPNGQVLYPVYISGGSGSSRRFQHTPYQEGAEVIVCALGRRGQAPYYILNGIFDPTDEQQINVITPVVDEYSTVNAADYAIRNGNSTLVLSDTGRAALTAGSINMQLRGGTLRISQQRLADNQLLNAAATISTLVEYIGELNAKIALLEQLALSSAPAVAAAYTAAIAAATTAGNAVLAAELTQQSVAAASAASALGASLPLQEAASIELSLNMATNQHIRVP